MNSKNLYSQRGYISEIGNVYESMQATQSPVTEGNTSSAQDTVSKLEQALAAAEELLADLQNDDLSHFNVGSMDILEDRIADLQQQIAALKHARRPLSKLASIITK